VCLNNNLKHGSHEQAAYLSGALRQLTPLMSERGAPPSPHRHRRATVIAAGITTAIATMEKALPRRQLTRYSRLTDDEAMPSSWWR